VRSAGSTKATTIERHRRGIQTSDDPPAGPLLSWSPGGSGDTRRGDGEVSFSHFGPWPWPLPPGETFEFAVEWAFGGIDLTIVELDGG
jgi:hypothetical protein